MRCGAWLGQIRVWFSGLVCIQSSLSGEGEFTFLWSILSSILTATSWWQCPGLGSTQASALTPSTEVISRVYTSSSSASCSVRSTRSSLFPTEMARRSGSARVPLDEVERGVEGAREAEPGDLEARVGGRWDALEPQHSLVEGGEADHVGGLPRDVVELQPTRRLGCDAVGHHHAPLLHDGHHGGGPHVVALVRVAAAGAAGGRTPARRHHRAQRDREPEPPPRCCRPRPSASTLQPLRPRPSARRPKWRPPRRCQPRPCSPPRPRPSAEAAESTSPSPEQPIPRSSPHPHR